MKTSPLSVITKSLIQVKIIFIIVRNQVGKVNDLNHHLLLSIGTIKLPSFPQISQEQSTKCSPLAQTIQNDFQSPETWILKHEDFSTFSNQKEFNPSKDYLHNSEESSWESQQHESSHPAFNRYNRIAFHFHKYHKCSLPGVHQFPRPFRMIFRAQKRGFYSK